MYRRDWRGVAAGGLFGGLFGGVSLIALAAQPAMAQGLSAVPSVQVLKGELVSPAAASAYYGGGTTSTNGLCAQFPSNAQVCTTLRPPEVKELARALRGDPDLIYEYVRNGIDTEFQYGLQKGALGVIIDKSGTAFDQASLMVELLRESGITASYKVGTITLTGTQFQAWTGLSDAKAACEFLAVGGVPAIINGSSPANCALSGSVSSVTLGHAWVEATIGGGTYQFDPAYKPYTHKAGIDVKAGMGFVAGQAATSAAGSSGTQSGLSYVTSMNQAGLSGLLQTWSGNLLSRLRQADMASADISDAIGGRDIQAAVRPAGGWRQSSLPYAAAATATWTGGVPDAYRTKMTMAGNLSFPANTPAFTTRAYFVDEIYGRRLQVAVTRMDNPSPDNQPYLYRPTVVLDGIAVETAATGRHPQTQITIQLTADHPFAAGAGAYADATVNKIVDPMFPAAIIHGWGRTSRELAGKWQREQGSDRLLPMTLLHGMPDQERVYVPTQAGDLTRARMGANWLAQFSQALEINSELAKGRGAHLHTLGVVSAVFNYILPPDATPPEGSGYPQDVGFSVADETTVVDLETAFGLTLRTSEPVDRRAAVHAIAATAASLEGLVAAEATDTPDYASTARRIAWGNAPDAGESPSLTSRRVFRFPVGSTGVASGVVVAENLATGAHGWFGTQNPLANPNAFKNRLYQTVDNYLTQGFEVVASNEAILGPGHRHGTEYPYYVDFSGGFDPYTYHRRAISTQVGGALVATKYDAMGDPISIAHVLTRNNQIFKGGGGSSINQVAQYDPKPPADVIKDRFVDRSSAVGVDLSNGGAGFTSPVLDSVGAGEAAPYRLDRRVELRGGAIRTLAANSPENSLADQDGWVSNWDGSAELSTSILSGMGEERLQAATPTIVAFMAMQDVWKAAPSAARETTGLLVADWWGRRLEANTVTINQGGSSSQYVHLADNAWTPTSGGGGRVEVAGARVLVRPLLALPRQDPQATQKEATSRVWKSNGLQIKAIGSQGDSREYLYWETPYIADATTESRFTGFRLDRWVYPNGMALTFTYHPTQRGVPTSVSNTFGATLTLPDLPNQPCGVANDEGAFGSPSIIFVPTLSATDVRGGVTKMAVRAPQLRTTTQRPDERCPVASVYTPVDGVTPSLSYVYDSVGRVKEARDGVSIRQPGSRGAHQFFIAEGYRGERQDPEGGRYAVETLEGGRLTRTLDELGRVTTSGLDGRKRVVSRTYPEGDQDLFGYDVRDNMVSLVKKAKPGSGLADLTSTVSYGEGPLVWTCVNPKICNRPTTSDGPRTDVVDVTSYSWNGSTGSLTQVLKPADSGGTRPQTDYGYTVLGGVSLMTSMTEKIDSSSSTTTTYEYDAGAQYRLKASTTDSGGLNLRTCYQYDAVGNITGVSDPRTATCPATIQ